MLKGETNRRPGSACGAPANGIHHHEHGPTLGSEKSVHIFRSPCFFHAILSKIAPHRSNEFFGIRHGPIVLYRPRWIARFAANGVNFPVNYARWTLGVEYDPGRHR